MTPARWTYLTALVLSAIGLLLAWATASAGIVSISVSGISTGDGKFLGSIVLMAAATGGWRFVGTNRINGVLAIVLWVAIAAFAFAEIIHVNNVFAHAPRRDGAGWGGPVSQCDRRMCRARCRNR